MHIAYCGPVSLDMLLPNKATMHMGTWQPYPFGAYYVRALLSAGHRVTVVANAFRLEQQYSYTDGDLAVIVTPRRFPRRFIVDAYRFERKAMGRVLSDSGADVVHAQWCYEYAHAARASGLPTVVTLRDDPWSVCWYFRTPYRLWRAIYAYWALVGNCRLTAVSEYIASVFCRSYFKGNIAVIPNAVDASIVSESCKSLNGFGALRLVSVTEWGRLKNSKTLIRAFSLIRKRFAEIKLSLIGYGMGEGESAHRWAQRHGLCEGIDFLGRKQQSDVLEYVEKHADLFVYASLNESFCMAVLEAMAKGVPSVVLPDAGALPWLVEYGQCGVVAGSRRASSLADACERILSNSDCYREISEKGLRRVKEHFTMDAVVDAYLNELRRAIAVCKK